MGEVRRGPAPWIEDESWEGGQTRRKPSRRYSRSQPGWLARPLSSESWSLALQGAYGNLGSLSHTCPSLRIPGDSY